MSAVVPPDAEQMRWIENIATSFRHSYEGLDVEDLRAHLVFKWYDRFEKIQGYVVDLDRARSKAFLMRTLTNWSVDYCRREGHSTPTCNLRPDDAYYYSRDQIQRMLPLVESPEAWSSLSVQGERSGRSGLDPAHGNNMLAHYADLTAGWDSLSPQERTLLRERYFGAGTPYVELGERLGMSEAYARKLVERAITKLQKHMGGAVRSGGRERRRAMSNASAQVLTRRQTEGA